MNLEELRRLYSEVSDDIDHLRVAIAKTKIHLAEVGLPVEEVNATWEARFLPRLVALHNAAPALFAAVEAAQVAVATARKGNEGLPAWFSLDAETFGPLADALAPFTEGTD